MSAEKISLGENIVEELEALWEKLEYRCRDRLLSELLDQLDAEYGPVDESLVQKYAGLLEGIP